MEIGVKVDTIREGLENCVCYQPLILFISSSLFSCSSFSHLYQMPSYISHNVLVRLPPAPLRGAALRAPSRSSGNHSQVLFMNDILCLTLHSITPVQRSTDVGSRWAPRTAGPPLGHKAGKEKTLSVSNNCSSGHLYPLFYAVYLFYFIHYLPASQPPTARHGGASARRGCWLCQSGGSYGAPTLHKIVSTPRRRSPPRRGGERVKIVSYQKIFM